MKKAKMCDNCKHRRRVAHPAGGDDYDTSGPQWTSYGYCVKDLEGGLVDGLHWGDIQDAKVRDFLNQHGVDDDDVCDDHGRRP